MALSTILVAVPALSRVEPAITSGPVSSAIDDVGQDVAAGRRAGDEDGRRAPEARVLERGAHERRHARGGDAADDVGRADGHAPQPLLGVAHVVLGPLDGAGERRRAAGDDGDHARRRDAEGGDALDRVERAEPPRRSGADVDQAAAGGQLVGGQLRGAADQVGVRRAPRRAPWPPRPA